MELWDVYDVNRNKTGKTVKRGGDTLGEGEYHLTVHIAIFSSDGKMLIQQRSKDKESWASMWDISVGGAVTAGEDSALGAERETEEEIGLHHDFRGLRPHLTVNHMNGFCDCYIIERDVDISTLRLQESEVQAVKYATLDEIFDMMNEGSFIPYHESFIQLLFDMRKRHSAHRK